MNVCKGFCVRYQAKRLQASKSMYREAGPDIKYCRRCETWLKLVSSIILCPCCHVKLRAKPLNNEYRRQKHYLYQRREQQLLRVSKYWRPKTARS